MKQLQIRIVAEEKFPQAGFNINSREVSYLVYNSVERFLSTIEQDLLKSPKYAAILQDLKDIKPLLCNLWLAAQNAVRLHELQPGE